MAISAATRGAIATAARASRKSARVRRARKSSTVRAISKRAAHRTLRAAVGKRGIQPFTQPLVRSYQVLDRRCIGPIDRQVAKFVGMFVKAVNVEMCRDTRLFRKSRQRSCLVDTIFSHMTVCGPFTTRDGEETARIDVDGVVAGEGCGVPGVA